METLWVRYNSWLVFDEDYQPIYRSNLINDILHFKPFEFHRVDIPNNSYNQITFSKYEFNGVVECILEKDTHTSKFRYFEGSVIVIKAGKLRFCIFWDFTSGIPPKVGDILTGSGELYLVGDIYTLAFFNKNDNPELFNYFFVRKIHKVKMPDKIIKTDVNDEKGIEPIDYIEFLEGSEYIREEDMSEVEIVDDFDCRYYLMEVYFHIKKQIKSS
jgi:hypothetical protein